MAPWPLITVLAKDGQGEGTLANYIEAADLINAIVVIPNETSKGGRAISTCTKDIKARLKISPHFNFMVGLNGFSGTAYTFASAKKEKIRGILVDGADGGMKSPGIRYYYGVTDSKGVAGIVPSFHNIIKNKGKLTVFPNGIKDSLEVKTEGIAWLYSKKLPKVKQKDVEAYISPFTQKLEYLIDKHSASDLNRAYELAKIRVASSRADKKPEANKQLSVLKNNKNIKRDLAAQKSLRNFLRKVFCAKRVASPEQRERAARKLRKKYRDTIYGPIFKDLSL